MALSPFLIVLGRGNDGGARIGWRRGCGWCGVGVRVRIGRRGRVGDATEDDHETGDDDEDRPTVAPGEDVEGVQKEEDADQSDPNGAAKGAEEAVTVGGSAVVSEAGPGIGHLANEE